jgi:hypothetical protein
MRERRVRSELKRRINLMAKGIIQVDKWKALFYKINTGKT